MLQHLEKEEENTCEIVSTFSSLQQEVEAKTRKLKKLFAKLQSVKQEIGDSHEEFCRDRADLQQTQDELTRLVELFNYFVNTLLGSCLLGVSYVFKFY